MSDPYRTAAVVESPKPKFRVVRKMNDEAKTYFHVERQNPKVKGGWEYLTLELTEKEAIKKAQALQCAVMTPDKVVWESE